MKRRLISLSLLLILISLFPTQVFAQTYSFTLNTLTANVYLNQDGTMAIDYIFVFTNDTWASPLDYVDVGLPNGNFDLQSITADVNGVTVKDISSSGYMGEGVGVAVGLGNLAIKSGKTGQVHVYIGRIDKVLYPDSDDNSYASAVFSPTWFGSQYVSGTTNMTVSFHLPPGVQPEQPRWHKAPDGFPEQPTSYHDDQGRIVYEWKNPNAYGYQQYLFGASFPASYVPAGAIVRPNIFETFGIDPEDLLGLSCFGGFFAFFIGIIALANRAGKKRLLQYYPPKIAIEGHGIKRGLTAVESAILLEQPLDKVLTMILFGTIKKNVCRVTKKDPLELEVVDPLPEGLHPYEADFLNSFRKNPAERRKLLQEMMINLVKNTSTKMKGFSRRETVAYYQDIVKRAWAQVEAAQTPEVKSAKYDEVMEWTMLDKDYDDRTREVFRGGPVFVPMWWPRYDPSFGRGAVGRPTPAPVSAPAMGGGKVSLPHLPGSDFAASVVNGVQTFSAGVVGNITSFTNNITSKTNPPPVTTSSSYRGGGGGGRSCACACACACAGCACACAGGGR